MPVAVVRYGLLRQLGDFLPAGPSEPTPHQRCVISTSRGEEVGTVLALVERVELAGVRPLLRLAGAPDLELVGENERRVREEDLPLLREVAQSKAPAVRIVGAERLLSGEKLIAYYAAQEVVDMPGFLRDLHSVFDTLIELEQVGARKRARICGGAGVCGRTLCCSTFLRRMEPVAMRMAKIQGLSLTPEVTAGACGRLKCCLRYENPLYEEHHRGLPREGWKVTSRRVEGIVEAVDVLRRRVLVRPTEGPPMRIFAAEITKAGPPHRSPLPVAGEPPRPAAEEEAPEEVHQRGWSTLARRLWRRVTPKPPHPPEDDE